MFINDDARADKLDMLADEHEEIHQFFKDVDREHRRSKLAKAYGIPISSIIKKRDSGYLTYKTVKELGDVHTSYPLAGGTMIEKAQIIDGRLVRSGVFKKNGKKIFTMDPEQLIIDLVS